MFQVSYFSDWGGKDVILFWADKAADFRGLGDVLSQLLSTGRGHHFTGLDTEIDLRSSQRSCGMQRQRDGSFLWMIDGADADRFADLVTALVETSIPAGHQYLECNVRGEITVMVSHGEYPTNLKSR